MVGDSPEADVAGGQAAGIQTAWIRRGRLWTGDDPMPDLLVDSVSEAATLVIAQQGQ
jgi:FMN phosphatase YigB (HAD superfamily)